MGRQIRSEEENISETQKAILPFFTTGMSLENLILGEQLEPCFVMRVDGGDFRKLE